MIQILILISISSLIPLIISRKYLKNLDLVFSLVIIKSEMSFTSVFFLVHDKNTSVTWLQIHTVFHMLHSSPICGLHCISLHLNSLCPIIHHCFKLIFPCYIVCIGLCYLKFLWSQGKKIDRNICVWLLY